MDAHPGFVGLEIRLVQEADIVTGHHREPECRQRCSALNFVLLFLVSAGALQFDIKPVRETPWPSHRPVAGPVGMAGQDGLADIAFTASRQGNQSSACSAPSPAHIGHSVVLAFQVSAAQQVAQVQVALSVLA